MNTPQTASASANMGDRSLQDGEPETHKHKKSAAAFRTISEVAEDLGVQQHVLRFWETKFSQVRPLKRGGGRRYYRPEDVVLLKAIHHLLYTQGYTIRGVQKLLKDQGKTALLDGLTAPPVSKEVSTATTVSSDPSQIQEASSASLNEKKYKAVLEAMLGELKDLRAMIRKQD